MTLKCEYGALRIVFDPNWPQRCGHRLVAVVAGWQKSAAVTEVLLLRHTVYVIGFVMIALVDGILIIGLNP